MKTKHFALFIAASALLCSCASKESSPTGYQSTTASTYSSSASTGSYTVQK